MRDCFIKAYNVDMSEGNLPTCGMLYLINNSSSPSFLSVGYGGIPHTLTVKNGYFTNESGTDNLGTEKEVPTTNIYSRAEVWVSPGATLCVPDKYALKYFYYQDTGIPKGWRFDEEEFTYLRNLNYMIMSGHGFKMSLSKIGAITSLIVFTSVAGKLEGDISELAGCINLEGTVNISYNINITGNIASIASWKKVTTFYIHGGTNITGEATDLGDAMYDNGNGRTSGALKIYSDGNVTYNGTPTSSVTLTFSENGVSYSPVYI